MWFGDFYTRKPHEILCIKSKWSKDHGYINVLEIQSVVFDSETSIVIHITATATNDYMQKVKGVPTRKLIHQLNNLCKKRKGDHGDYDIAVCTRVLKMPVEFQLEDNYICEQIMMT